MIESARLTAACVMAFENERGVTNASGFFDLPATTVHRAFAPAHLPGANDRVGIAASRLVVGFPLGFCDTRHHVPVVRQAVVASLFGQPGRAHPGP